MRWVAGAAAIGVVVAMGASVAAAAPRNGGIQGSQRSPRTFRMDPQLESRLNQLGVGGSQLGVTLRDPDAAEVKERKRPSAQGVLVESVQPGGPADKAGIRAGDLISDFDGEHVRSVRQLRRLLSETPEALPVKIGVVRDGHRLEFLVSPGAAGPGLDDSFAELLRRGLDGNLRNMAPIPLDPQGLPEHRSYDDWPSGAGRLGVVTQEMTPQLTAYFGAKEGVLVTSVTDDSPAARAGVRAGDVVTAVGGAAVKTPVDLSRAIRAVPDGQDFTITVVRNRQPLALKAKLGGSRLTPHA